MGRTDRAAGAASALRSIARGRRRGGFTLIEMIVASILLFVGVVAALEGIAAATRSAGIANEMTVATMLAQKHIAETEIDTTQLSGGAQSGDFTDDYAGYHWDQNVDTTDFTNLVKVTLTISWSSGAMPRSAQFVTYETIPDTSGSGATGPATGTGGAGGAGGAGG
jgi:type II secretion system protein I